MLNIKDICPAPSDALQAMIDGLLEQTQRNDFRLDMRFYAYNTPYHYCAGCAASCTIQKIAGKNFTNTISQLEKVSVRAYYLDIDICQFYEFEAAINAARKGYLHLLFRFYEIPFMHQELNKQIKLLQRPWSMQGDNWRQFIPAVEDCIKELKSKSL